jgi:hypothetical protein
LDTTTALILLQTLAAAMSRYNVNPFETDEPEERKSIILLEGSQATPARPSGRNKVKVKTLW